MKLDQVVEWGADVFPSWRKAATNSAHTNSDIWSRLPSGVCWVAGEIEQHDLPQLFVVGSQDWRDVFGSYQLTAICKRYLEDCTNLAQQRSNTQLDANGDDPYHHHTRIERLARSMRNPPPSSDVAHSGTTKVITPQPLILVAANVAGPKVLLDGNHRALAMLQLDILVGQRCFLGLHSKMASDFLWMKRALAA